MLSQTQSEHGPSYGRWAVSACALVWFVVLFANAWQKQLIDQQTIVHARRVLLLVGVVLALWAASGLIRVRAVSAAIFWVLAAAIVLLNIYFITPKVALAGIATVVVGFATGALLLRRTTVDGEVRIIVGLACLAGLVGWLVPYPVHFSYSYWTLAAILALLLLYQNRNSGVARRLHSVFSSFDYGWPSFVALVSLFMVSIGLWLPTVGYDDNAGHLLLVTQILDERYYHLDVSTQLWAVSPWLGNVLHAIAAVFAGEEARAAANAVWIALGAAAAYRLTNSLLENRTVSLLSIALYLSHPFTTYFATNMQVDGVTAIVYMTLLAHVVRCDGKIASPVVLGALFGFMAGLKVSNILFAALPLIVVSYNSLRSGQAVDFVKMVFVALAVSGSSYFYAYLVTGNPVFPLFNAVFQSPYMDAVNFHDDRWRQNLSFASIWDFTYHTNKYGEFYPGALGLAFIALVPFSIPLAISDRKFRFVFCSAAIGGVLMCMQVQYVRYLFPAIVVLTSLGLIGAYRYLFRPAFYAAILALSLANFILMPSIGWVAHADPWADLLEGGVTAKASVERKLIPEKSMMLKVIDDDRDACVLIADPDAPFIGGAGSKGFAMAWYDRNLPAARSAAESDGSGRVWAATIRTLGVSHVIVNLGKERALIYGLRRIGFQPIDMNGFLQVWASPDPRNRVCTGRIKEIRNESSKHFWP